MLNQMVLDLLNDNIFSFSKLLKYLKISKKELQATLDNLIYEEKVLYDRYFNQYYPIKEATLNVKEMGYAFAKVDGEEEEYYIAEGDLLDAYDGDSALIYPFERGSKLMNARVIKINNRAHKTIVGLLKCKKTKKGEKYYIKSSIKSFPVNANVRPEHLNNAEIGSIVYADVTYQGTAINAKITQRVGFPDDPGIEISQIALEYGFFTEFPLDVLDEINNIPEIVLDNQKENRRDFTANLAITIDGDDSKDFDDAVYLECDEDSYKLHVYIADVAEYVKEEAPLDIEAFKRGTSVYLADRVIPMLPRKLSNGICSLNEGVERLVLACIMEIDKKGNLVNYEICEGVIKSAHRMTYNNVNKMLNGDEEIINKYNDIYPMILKMKELSDIIRQRRYKKGGIEFEVDEYKINLNADGSPNEILLRTRDSAEKLIEDFMLEANETVAYHMSISNLPCAYRIHEKPDQEKLHNVFSLISNMGVSLKNTKNDIHPKQIQDALEKISDSPYQPIINNMLLRSMMKAKYNEKCLGHYGLAMNYYCHFTSPIRRYPDLITHRIIKRLLLHPNNYENDLMHFEIILPEACLKNSASERKAIECERAVNDMLYAWYMSRYINSKFCGIITSLSQFGMYITLENGIEGLVAYRDMDGYFTYNANTLSVYSSDRMYKIGDKVNIVVIKANKKEGKIDFMLQEDYDIYYGDEI